MDIPNQKGSETDKILYMNDIKRITQTWLCELVTVVQRWVCSCIAAEVSVTKANVVDSSCTLVVIEGGTSLMTHNTKAEGTDEPGKTNDVKLITKEYQ